MREMFLNLDSINNSDVNLEFDNDLYDELVEKMTHMDRNCGKIIEDDEFWILVRLFDRLPSVYFDDFYEIVRWRFEWVPGWPFNDSLLLFPTENIVVLNLKKEALEDGAKIIKTKCLSTDFTLNQEIDKYWDKIDWTKITLEERKLLLLIIQIRGSSDGFLSLNKDNMNIFLNRLIDNHNFTNEDIWALFNLKNDTNKQRLEKFKLGYDVEEINFFDLSIFFSDRSDSRKISSINTKVNNLIFVYNNYKSVSDLSENNFSIKSFGVIKKVDDQLSVNFKSKTVSSSYTLKDSSFITVKIAQKDSDLYYFIDEL